MEWIVVAFIGITMGSIFSFIARSVHMPQALCVLIGVVGALAGGAIERVANISTFGSWAFYITGAALSLGVLAGGMLAFSLTSDEKRV